MILADKIIKLRKRYGWSQEELAEKMNVSRQSVSKWESTASIPDLNKIILLAELFGVTTDFLLKDNIELEDSTTEDNEPGIIRISIEDATSYIKSKTEAARMISIGVVLSVWSVIPLFFLLALSEGNEPYIDLNIATAVGLTSLFILIGVAIRFFLVSNQKKAGFIDLENNKFELSYGVKSIIDEKIIRNQSFYTKRLSLSIFMLITSPLPLILTSIFIDLDMVILLMLVLMFVIVGVALYIMIPAVMKHNSYNYLIGEGDFAPGKLKETKRAEKFGSFYWPTVTAIYIGWSLWTMNWGVTWIVWPIAAIAFAGFVGLIGMFDSDK